MRIAVDYFRRHPRLMLCLVTLALLLPFIDKAVHMDDTLFVWAARHIMAHPADPFGFDVNWYGTQMSFFEVTKNPPLVSYLLAPLLALTPAGIFEPVLHLLLAGFALAAVLLFHELACKWTHAPIAATLAFLAAPCFLISATSLMCDVPMVAFYLGAIVWFVAGLERRNFLCLAGASICIVLSFLSKYFGATLIPLLAVYVLLRFKERWRGLLFLLPPVLVLLMYHNWSIEKYGSSHFLSAFSYVAEFRPGGELPIRLLTALSFVGGCLLPACALAVGRLGKYSLTAAASLLLALVLAGYSARDILLPAPAQSGILLVAQLAILATLGAVLAFALGPAAWHRLRSPEGVLLLCWLGGTLVFAVGLNWTVNARTLLPAMPPAILLILGGTWRAGPMLKRIAIGGSMLAAIVAVMKDVAHADSARKAAHSFATQIQTLDVQFEGHWGFQFYMQELGAKPLDFLKPKLRHDTFIVRPRDNTNLKALNPDVFPVVDRRVFPVLIPAAVMNEIGGAGFYSSTWGPLPFSFGVNAAEEYTVYRVPLQLVTP